MGAGISPPSSSWRWSCWCHYISDLGYWSRVWRGTGPGRFHQQLRLACSNLSLPQGHPDTTEQPLILSWTGAEQGLLGSVQSSFTPAESFTWRDLLQPERYCRSGRTQRQPGSSEDLAPRLPRVWGKSVGQRLRPRHANSLFLSPVSDSHLLPTSTTTPGCLGNQLHVACLAVRREGMGDEVMWENGSGGAKRNVEFG